MIFNVWLRLDEGKNTISREDRNITNSLVKFADNLPLDYFIIAPQKQEHFDEKRAQTATASKFIIKIIHLDVNDTT